MCDVTISLQLFKSLFENLEGHGDSGTGACRGIRCDSPTFSFTPFSLTFGTTPKILSATPDLEVPQPY